MFARYRKISTVGAYGYAENSWAFRANGQASIYQVSTDIILDLYQTMSMNDSTRDNVAKLTNHTKHSQDIKTTSTQEIENVYFSSYELLCRNARLLVDDTATATDVVQEAFVKALVAQPTFKNDNALAYMKTAVMNQARSTLRKRGVSRKYLSVTNVHDTEIANQEVDDLPIDAQVISGALLNLSTRQRECIMLSNAYSMTHKEIARQLGISEGSVKQHLLRGLKALKAALEGER